MDGRGSAAFTPLQREIAKGAIIPTELSALKRAEARAPIFRRWLLEFAVAKGHWFRRFGGWVAS